MFYIFKIKIFIDLAHLIKLDQHLIFKREPLLNFYLTVRITIVLIVYIK